VKESRTKPSSSFHSTQALDGYELSVSPLSNAEYRAVKLGNQRRTNILLCLLLFFQVCTLAATIAWSVFVTQAASKVEQDADKAILTAQTMMDTLVVARTMENVGWLVADFVANQYPGFTNTVNATFSVLDAWVAHNNSALLSDILRTAQTLFSDSSAISTLFQQAVAARVTQSNG
jgi:hypothetical protein